MIKAALGNMRIGERKRYDLRKRKKGIFLLSRVTKRSLRTTTKRDTSDKQRIQRGRAYSLIERNKK